MKNIIILFIFLMIIPLVNATDFTYKQNTIVDIKIPCFTNENAFCNDMTNCTITINKPNGNNLINNQNMSRFPSFYNYTLNLSQTTLSGVYEGVVQCRSNATTNKDGYSLFNFELTASGKEQKASTAGLAIVIFTLFIVTFLLIIGFRREMITQNIIVDLIIRRSCFVLSIYFMILNSTMVATIAGAANIDLTTEMFVYVNVFGWLGYAAMVYLIFKTLVDYLSLWQQKKRDVRGFNE